MPKRIRVRGVERVVMGGLAPGPRARLIDRLFDLWGEYFVGADRDWFDCSFADDTHVVTTLGPGGDLAGYGYINRVLVDVGGRRHLALGGGFFTRQEYAGTPALMLALFQETLRIRLSYPTLPVTGISIAKHPIIYDRCVRSFATFAPAESSDPPPEALVIAHAYARAHHFPIDPSDPWVIRESIRLRQLDRVLASRAYAKRTPAMQAFERRVPNWTAGDGLLVWAPLSLSNVARTMLRLARR